jgi:hypothetical protein
LSSGDSLNQLTANFIIAEFSALECKSGSGQKR